MTIVAVAVVIVVFIGDELVTTGRFAHFGTIIKFSEILIMWAVVFLLENLDIKKVWRAIKPN